MEVLLGMLEFLLFQESAKVRKDVSLIDGLEYGWSKGSMEATEIKAEQELDIRIKGRRKEEVFVMHFFCSGIAQNVFFFRFYE